MGESARMREIHAIIKKAASWDANVCIEGENGTGKELVARALHMAGPRRDLPLRHAGLLDDCRRPDREPPVRSRARGVHRRGVDAPGRLRAGAHRHAVHRRDHGAGLASAGQAAAGDPDRRVHDGGRQSAPAGERADHHRDQSRPAAGGRQADVPRGSLLPHRGHPHRDPAAAGAPRRHPAARRAFPPCLLDLGAAPGDPGPDRAGHDRADDLLLARQRAPAEELDRAGAGAGGRRPDRPRALSRR